MLGMLAISLLVGLGTAAVATAVVTFWDDIKSFLRKTFDKVKTLLTQTIKSSLIEGAIAGFKTYLQTGSIATSLYKASKVAIQKFYSQTSNRQWKETIFAKKLELDNIPNELAKRLQYAGDAELDISQEVKTQLELLR